ncbi:unnamed protein product [Brugia pahangi]|uniref:Secreted protein n=1 Tax=Brugia pahangi TaxID=6280 RepID=A0A0N4TIS8_BRUPA|nr:unnamed protein product [Brugia pahangi]
MLVALKLHELNIECRVFCFVEGHGSAQCTSSVFPATIIRSKGTLQARRCPILVCQQRCMSLPAVFPCFSHIFYVFSEVICFQQ